MTDYPIRRFADDAAIAGVGERFLAHTLPKAEWTHEAHLATCLWLLRDRPDVDVDRRIRTLISGYNESLGGVNDDAGGYHDTITHAYVAAIRTHLRDRPAGERLVEAVNALLVSPFGRRDWPLQHYSRERLFSAAARRGFVAPDLAPLP